MGEFDQQAKYFKVLMHPARLAILDALRDGEHCVCHIEALLGYRQAYISQQLTVLRDAGLVGDRREGWNIYYHVNQPAIYAVIDTMDRFASRDRASRMKRLEARRAKHCPCPKCTVIEQSDTKTETLLN